MIYYKLIRLYEITANLFWQLFMHINMLLWHIKHGASCKFSGRTLFRVYPGGSIIIGCNNLFNSSKYSNQVGIYCPCMISTLNPNARITIGNNCGFSGTIISSALSIKIGNNVRVGANTLITDTDFHTDDYRAGCDKEVVIEDNVWIGVGVKIMKGVHIGKNTMIGAGSIVTKDIPANVIAAGIPCKIIKTLDL